MSEANKPAYPVAEDHKIAADFDWTVGLTKREYIAIEAMKGILPEMLRRVDAYNHHGGLVDANGIGESVRLSQIAADAMLYETEYHSDMLALVETLADQTEHGMHSSIQAWAVKEARRILGRSE